MDAIAPEVVAHEVGHLVVGLFFGFDEQGVVFARCDGNLAQAGARLSKQPPKRIIIRCLAGLLTQIHFCPNSVGPRFLEAYRYSIILSPEHPYRDKLAQHEWKSPSGACADLEIALKTAELVHQSDSQAVLAILRSSEEEGRRLIEQLAEVIQAVIIDVRVWAQDPDREFEPLLHYHSERAQQVAAKAGLKCSAPPTCHARG